MQAVHQNRLLGRFHRIVQSLGRQIGIVQMEHLGIVHDARHCTVVARYDSPVQCNIDARGKGVRLTSGLVMMLIGAGLLASCAAGILAGDWPTYIGIGLLAAGAFGVFEGWVGWCAIRALGFRTRI